MKLIRTHVGVGECRRVSTSVPAKLYLSVQCCSVIAHDGLLHHSIVDNLSAVYYLGSNWRADHDHAHLMELAEEVHARMKVDGYVVSDVNRTRTVLTCAAVDVEALLGIHLPINPHADAVLREHETEEAREFAREHPLFARLDSRHTYASTYILVDLNAEAQEWIGAHARAEGKCARAHACAHK